MRPERDKQESGSEWGQETLPYIPTAANLPPQEGGDSSQEQPIDGGEIPNEMGISHQVMEIGGYEILSELGRGGMGVVYLARQRSLNRMVAIKMLIGASFAGEIARIRFRREAEFIAALKHPNIVAIHEISEFEGMPYYCMDYIEGVTLKKLVMDDPLDWRDAAAFLKTTALAMHYAHEQGVIHRDLKPHNIMVDSNRNLQITDFGLARDMNMDSGLTISGATVGTPGYMAPELLGSNAQAVTAASDIYAMGAILYELLTSIPPFIGGSLQEVLEKVKYWEPLAPRLINPSFPRDLNTVCLKCLEKDPQKRYATALELAQELDRVMQDIPVLAKPIGLLEKFARWCGRNKSLSMVIIASTIIIVGGGVGAFWQLNLLRIRAERSEKVAVNNFNAANEEKQKAIEALNAVEKAKKDEEEARRAEERAKEEAYKQKKQADESQNNLKVQKEENTQIKQEVSKERASEQTTMTTLTTLKKTAEELLADKAAQLLDHQEFVGAYQSASEVLKNNPQEIQALRVLAAAELACFNLSGAISWLEQARKVPNDPASDEKILSILQKFQPVVEKLPDPMADRELQVALSIDLSEVDDPLFSGSSTYLKNTDPAFLNEQLKKVRHP